MTAEIVSVYEGENITITYDRRRCIHAAECGRSRNPVFDVTKDPWIDPNLSDVESIVCIIQRCPTAALTYQRKDGGPEEPAPERNTITVSPNGPLYVRGQVQILRADGTELSREYRVALCRCGQSKYKPICDNSHLEAGFRDLGPINADPDVGQTLEAGVLKITVLKNGPLRVEGPVTVYAGNGREAMRATELYLCRCGASQNKPFCDGTHKKIGFRPDSSGAE
jgi:CDGSH-type Zn-finger protein/uncharacterized Fe-S cluster protein YjdI